MLSTSLDLNLEVQRTEQLEPSCHLVDHEKVNTRRREKEKGPKSSYVQSSFSHEPVNAFSI
jgi:hypothetical protein